MKSALKLLFAAVFSLSSGLANSSCMVHGTRDLLPFYASFPLIAEGKVLELAVKPVRNQELDAWPLRLTKFQITSFLKAPQKSKKYESRSAKSPSNVYWMMIQDRDLHVGDRLLIFATLETVISAYLGINEFPANQSRVWFADNGSCDSSVYRVESTEGVALKRRVIRALKKGLLPK